MQDKVRLQAVRDKCYREERLRTLREKCKQLTTEELVALAALMKRRTDDLKEELKVLTENIAKRDAFDFFGHHLVK